MCGAGGNIARGALLTLLLAPVVVVLDRLGAVSDLPLFVLAGAALIPLSWLIGEATDHLARHTGPGIGGFLNATFGNAPELIIATIAASDGLTAIVRASLMEARSPTASCSSSASRSSSARRVPSIAGLPTPRSAWSDSPPLSCSSSPRRGSMAIRNAAPSSSSRFLLPCCSWS